MSSFLLFFSNNALIFLALIFLVSAAFFTSSEVALISASRSRLKKLRKEGNAGASIALILLDNVESLLITTQFGTNLSIASATTVLTLYSIIHIGSSGEWYVVAIITPFVLLFCDSLPKILARSYPEEIGLRFAYPLFFIRGFLKPITGVLSFYTKRISRLAGGQEDSLTLRRKTREQLNTLLSGSEGEMKLTQKRMVRNILEFSQQSVRNAMLPLVKVDAIESEASIKEAIELFENLRHSRIPIYSNRIDNIVGILNFMDLFNQCDLDDNVTDHMSSCIYAPEHQRLEALLMSMEEKQESMAIVVDEYGGAVGIITKEDVLEEVVGNLSDEFDENTLFFHQISENTFLVNVNIEISNFNERMGDEIPKGDYETLSGFLLQQFNCIPSLGSELHYGNLKFKVYRATSRAVQFVIVSKR